MPLPGALPTRLPALTTSGVSNNAPEATLSTGPQNEPLRLTTRNPSLTWSQRGCHPVPAPGAPEERKPPQQQAAPGQKEGRLSLGPPPQAIWGPDAQLLLLSLSGQRLPVTPPLSGPSDGEPLSLLS